MPLVDWVVERAVDRPDDPGTALFVAIAEGDSEATLRALKAGADLDSRGEDGGTFLHWAAFIGDPEVVRLLLEAGADPTVVDYAGNTPVGSTFVFGNEEAADLLVAAGAPDPRVGGQDWDDVPWWAFGAEDAPKTDETADDDGFEGPETWIASFHHLWFLWFLCLFVVGFVVVARIVEFLERSFADRIPLDRVAWTVMWLLIPFTFLPQLRMGEWGEFRVFGPDTSTALVPDFHVLAYYAVFFGFGALMYNRRNRSGELLVDTIGRHWAVLLPLTVIIVLPIALGVTYADDPIWPLAAALQVTFAWAMIIGLMGLSRRFLAVERPGVRYLSDLGLLAVSDALAAGDRRSGLGPRLGPPGVTQVLWDQRGRYCDSVGQLSAVRPLHAHRLDSQRPAHANPDSISPGLPVPKHPKSPKHQHPTTPAEADTVRLWLRHMGLVSLDLKACGRLSRPILMKVTWVLRVLWSTGVSW